MTKIETVFVVAVAENGVIGRGNGLPWHIRSDLKRFKARTLGKPVVMGRKTFLSIGKPLPGRTNIVVTRDTAFAVPGVTVAHSLEDAMAAARGDALRRGVAEIAVIGGGEVFTALMPRADRLEVTIVHAAPEGDAFFPPIDQALWREAARETGVGDPADTAPVSYVTYRREKADAGQ